jgi:prolyl oligopeptidase
MKMPGRRATNSIYPRLSAFICGSISCLAFAQAPATAPGDPYAALENATQPQTQAFWREQEGASRGVLDRISGRAQLRQRIAQLSASQTLVHDVALGGPRLFYLKLEPGAQASRLVMREGAAGGERLLLDPAALLRDSGGEIEWISPSPDGRQVAFGLAHAGVRGTVLRVVGVEGGALQPFEIDRVPRGAQVEWQPDGRGFYYPRDGEDGRATRIYHHQLGRGSDRDELVFAPGVGGAVGVPEGARATLQLPEDSRYAYAVVRAAAGPEIAVHVAETKELAAGKPRWRRIAAPGDGVIAIEGGKDDLYVLTRKNAPRHRILRVKAGATSLEGAKVAVNEGDSVIRSMALARDALYLRTMVAGVDRLERLPLGLLGGNAPQFVRIPFDVTIAQMVAQPRSEGVFLHLEGWIDPPSLVHVDRRGDAKALALQQPASKTDFTQVDEVRLYATSTEGVKIPITLLYKKSTRLSRDNPTLLFAYGSYGVPLMPTFDAARMAWLERGGVLAVAHLRGGGEYGEAWHEAGRGELKRNTVSDLVAVADFITAYGFTSPRRLAVMGTGEGAVPAALALERRPDLFAAAVFRTPLADLARAVQEAGGEALQAEFGSNAAALSPVHQVRQAMPYPAVLLTTRTDPASLPAWHAAKLAARLQSSTSSGRPILLRTPPQVAGPRDAREEELTDLYAFLLWQMGDPQFQGPPAATVGPVAAH